MQRGEKRKKTRRQKEKKKLCRGIHRGYSEGQRGMQKKNELKFMYKYANVCLRAEGMQRGPSSNTKKIASCIFDFGQKKSSKVKRIAFRSRDWAWAIGAFNSIKR